MASHITLCCRDDGHWYVTADGTYLVGFSGPRAHEMAARQRKELAELLECDEPESSERDEATGPFPTDW